MTTKIAMACALAAALVPAAGWGEQKPGAHYRGPSPHDGALVKRAEAARWRDTDSRRLEAGIGKANTDQVQDCVTQIGRPAPEPSRGGRFGPGNNNREVIVVTGSVINICK